MWPDKMEFQSSSMPDKNEEGEKKKSKQAAAWVDMDILKKNQRDFIFDQLIYNVKDLLEITKLEICWFGMSCRGTV